MSNYNGTKCISCDEIFKDNDDVVVCPECGTPYHRECYLKEGQCINTSLHESGESWQPVYESKSSDEADSSEPKRCIRCGAENPPEGIFCNKCGMPLNANNNNASRPFNFGGADDNRQAGFKANQNGFPFGAQMVFDKDSDLDGIKLDDYAKYVGRNSLGLLSNFIRFANFGGKISLNIAALMFPEFYFFYRKMYKHGVLFLLVITLLSIPSMIVMGQSGVMNVTFLQTNFDLQTSSFANLYSISSYLIMAVRFIAGFFGNYFYYRTAKADITKIRRETLDEYAVGEKIIAKGGTSAKALIVAITVYCVLTLGGMYLINLLFA